MGVLLRARLAVEEPDPAASRGKIARLTSAGLRAQRRYLELLGTIEDRWQQRFGRDTLGALRQSLEALAVGPMASRRPCSRPSSPTRTTGGRRSARPARSRTTRWSCTAAATPTAAEPGRRANRSSRSPVASRPRARFGWSAAVWPGCFVRVPRRCVRKDQTVSDRRLVRPAQISSAISRSRRVSGFAAAAASWSWRGARRGQPVRACQAVGLGRGLPASAGLRRSPPVARCSAWRPGQPDQDDERTRAEPDADRFGCAK